MPAPTVRPLPGRTVVLAVVGGAAVTWGVFTLLERFGWPLPPAPLLGAVAIGLLAAVTGWLAVRTHRAVQRQRVPVAPPRALALARTAALGGAALAGAYAAIAVHSLAHLAADLPRARLLGSALALLASLGLLAAGVALERACRIPDPPDDTDDATPGEEPGVERSGR
jgi:hypothetical protein